MPVSRTKEWFVEQMRSEVRSAVAENRATIDLLVILAELTTRGEMADRAEWSAKLVAEGIGTPEGPIAQKAARTRIQADVFAALAVVAEEEAVAHALVEEMRGMADRLLDEWYVASSAAAEEDLRESVRAITNGSEQAHPSRRSLWHRVWGM